jgi:hypothetical protein
VTIGWEAMIVIIAGLCLLGFFGFVFISRDRHNRKLRFGFFFERERYDDEEEP